MELLRGAVPAEVGADDQALEVALAHAMLRRVSRGEAGPTLRVYRPAAAAMAFGRRDLRLPGMPEAVAAARAAGFQAVVRAPGGRAVAYTSQALVVDHVSPDPTWPSDMERRFVELGDLWVGVLRDLGVDARMGEVPGEYCPGSHSVNARGRTKLVGTAQRMVRGAWLFSAVLVFDGAGVLRPLLGDVYGALGLPFEDASVGSLSDEVSGLSLDRVEDAVLRAYDGRFAMAASELSPDLLDTARALLPEHLTGH